jgi:hypothetical protein
MENRKLQMVNLKDKKYTYSQIGIIFGISRQRVHAIITGYSSRKLHPRQITPVFDTLGRPISREGITLQGADFTREIIRRRDNYTCQICGRVWQEGQRRFDVHHIDCDPSKTKQYDNLEKEKNNMITLCHKCHLNIPEHREKMALANRNNADK